jgi:YD repeat-containing protein
MAALDASQTYTDVVGVASSGPTTVCGGDYSCSISGMAWGLDAFGNLYQIGRRTLPLRCVPQYWTGLTCPAGQTLSGSSCIAPPSCPALPIPLVQWILSPDQTTCNRNGPDPEPNCGPCQAGAPQTPYPINVGTGNKYLKEEDLVIGPLRLTRHYNAQILRSGLVFSPSWTYTWSRWIAVYGASQVAIYRPNGRTEPASLVNPTVTNGQQTWTLAAYSGDQLIRLTDSSGSITNGWLLIADDGELESYDANGRLLKIQTSQGRSQTLSYSDGTLGPNGGYILDSSGNATSAALPAGLLVRVSEDFGRGVFLGYNVDTQPVKVTDSLGQVYLYGYDANFNLTSVTYPDGKVRQYLNGESANVASPMPQAVTGILDENGTRYATYTYDSFGHATSSTHWKDAAATQPVDQMQIAFSTDVNGNPLSSIVTDPRGTQRTTWLTSVLNLVKANGANQPSGAGCAAAASSQSFDANGNLASVTDFDGNVTCFANDLTRNLETVRLEGLSSGGSCPANLATYTPAAGTPQRLIQTQWHPNWRIPVRRAEPKKITTWVYNGQPDPTNGNTTVNCAPPTANVNDPGALLHFDGAAGSTSIVDLLGHSFTGHGSAQLSAAQSKFGSTSLALNGSTDWVTSAASADLIFGTNDFTFETWTYLIASASSYPVLISKRASTANYSGVEVYAVASNGTMGAVVASSSGAWGINFLTTATISFNSWHHVAFVRHGSTFTLYLDGAAIGAGTYSGAVYEDGSGLNLGAGDTNGSAGLLLGGFLDETRLTLGVAVYTSNFTPPTAPLIPVASSVPNVLGNGVPPAVLCKRVEQATIDTTGASGFNATATGSARIWNWTYNQWGQVLTAKSPRTDVSGTTTTQYYAASDTAHSPPWYQMGDRQSVTDALGHVTQFTKYDGNGRLLEQVDPNGVTTDYAYFPRGWLQSVSVTPAGGGAAQVTSYLYDGVGQLTQSTLPDGSYVKYAYDSAHRLTTITDSANDTVNYTLDAIGNRQAETWKDPSGTLQRNIARAYDALNRLQTVTGAAQ